jgi:hypothetical protein
LFSQLHELNSGSSNTLQSIKKKTLQLQLIVTKTAACKGLYMAQLMPNKQGSPKNKESNELQKNFFRSGNLASIKVPVSQTQPQFVITRKRIEIASMQSNFAFMTAQYPPVSEVTTQLLLFAPTAQRSKQRKLGGNHAPVTRQSAG